MQATLVRSVAIWHRLTFAFVVSLPCAVCNFGLCTSLRPRVMIVCVCVCLCFFLGSNVLVAGVSQLVPNVLVNVVWDVSFNVLACLCSSWPVLGAGLGVAMHSCCCRLSLAHRCT